MMLTCDDLCRMTNQIFLSLMPMHVRIQQIGVICLIT